MSQASRRIGLALLRAGAISQGEYDEALPRALSGTTDLLAALAEVRGEPQELLADKLAEALGYARPADDLDVEEEAVVLVPVETEARGAVGLARTEGTLHVGVTDPTDVVLLDDLRFQTGATIDPVVLTAAELEEAKQRAAELRKRVAGTFDIDELVQDLVPDEDVFTEETGETFVSLIGEADREIASRRPSHHEELTDLEAAALDSPVVKLTNLMLVDSIKKGASALRLVASDERLTVEYRIDDEWHQVMVPPLRLGVPLVWRLKEMCELPAGAFRWPLVGHIRLRLGEDREQAYRVAFEPMERGVVVVASLCESRRLGGEPMPPLPFWGRLDAAQRATDTERKLQLLEEATAMAEERKRHYWAAHCLELTAAAWVDLGRSREADRALARARDHQDAHDATLSRIDGLLVHADLARARGDFDASARYLVEAQRRAVLELGPAHFDTMYVTRLAAGGLLDAGREQEAKGVLMQAASLHREVIGEVSWSGARVAMLGARLVQHDDPERALREARDVLALHDAVSLGVPDGVNVGVHAWFADVLRIAGRLDESIAEIERTRSLADEVDGDLPIWAEPDEVLALVCAERGDVEGARTALTRFRARFDATRPSWRDPARLAFVLGRVAEAEGRTGDARHSYDASRFGYYGREARRRLERLG